MYLLKSDNQRRYRLLTGKLLIISTILLSRLYSVNSTPILKYIFHKKPVPIVITTLKIPNPHLNRMKKYQVPNPTMKLTFPKGFSISIADSKDIKEFILGININTAFTYNNRPFKIPHLFARINKSTNGQWTYKNTDIELSLGDYVFYWIAVKHTNEKMFYKQNEYFRVCIFNKHLIIVNSYDLA